MGFVKAFRRITLTQPLDNWAWITVSYDEQAYASGYVTAFTQGYRMQEDNLRMYRYNPGYDGIAGNADDLGWQPLDNQILNTAENYVKAWTPLFSDFGLGGGAGNLLPDPNQVGAGGGGAGGGGGICLVGGVGSAAADLRMLAGLGILLLLCAAATLRVYSRD